MSDVRFIRNLRPNRVNIRVAGLKIGLERRGSRADTAAVPITAFSERDFLVNFQRGVIEEIEHQVFLKLATRLEDEPQGWIKERQFSHNFTDVENPEIPFQQYREFLSPHLEFETISDSEEDAERAVAEPEPELEEEPVPVPVKPLAPTQKPRVEVTATGVPEPRHVTQIKPPAAKPARTKK